VDSFLQRHASEIKGTLSGLDRVRFRGSLRQLCHWGGMMKFLGYVSVLLKEFKDWALDLTTEVREATRKLAESAGRPVRFLPSSAWRKEDIALRIAQEDGINEGLIAVLTCVESCATWQVRKDRERKLLVLEPHSGRCLHEYFYFLHPQLGLMHVRLQTFIPFTVHVCINGREWLARELTRRNLGFEQRDNCFVDLADVAQTQQVFDQLLETDWCAFLDGLLRTVHPSAAQMFGKAKPEYYWSADETEWATDIMFRSPEALAGVYQPLVRHAITTHDVRDVLRFFGKRPNVRSLQVDEVESSLGERVEGMRIKHQLNKNSVKMYDKQETVLRVETTIVDTSKLRVRRGSEQNPDDVKLRRMRKGVADLSRRADASQSVNTRFLESLSAVDCQEALQTTIAPLCQPTELGGRRLRALSPFQPAETRVLEAVNRGEFLLHGFRNQDLRALLFTGEQSLTRKQQAGKVTRLLRLLRAHGLIRKVPHSHRYQVTKTGRLQITAILAAQHTATSKLVQIAA